MSEIWPTEEYYQNSSAVGRYNSCLRGLQLSLLQCSLLLLKSRLCYPVKVSPQWLTRTSFHPHITWFWWYYTGFQSNLRWSSRSRSSSIRPWIIFHHFISMNRQRPVGPIRSSEQGVCVFYSGHPTLEGRASGGTRSLGCFKSNLKTYLIMTCFCTSFDFYTI